MNPFNPYDKELRERNHMQELSRALRNLQVLSLVNFAALLWILYLLGGR